MSVTASDADLATVWDTPVDDAPVALSARHGLIAVAGAAGTAWILDAATGACIDTFELPGGALGVVLAPDARHAAASGPTGYALWRGEDGRTTVRDTGAWSATAAWADNERGAIAAGRRALVLTPDGKELWATEPAASTVTDLAWLRQGRRLAVAAYGAAAPSTTARPWPSSPT